MHFLTYGHQEINQQLTGHFDNLALAAAERKEDFTSLTASVERLSKQNEELVKTNAKLTNQLEAALNRIRNLESNNGGGWRGGGNPPGGNPSGGSRNSNHRPGSHGKVINLGGGVKVRWPFQGAPWPTEADQKGYCWTCGYCVAPGHNYDSCPRAKENPSHQKDATRANPKGGSLANAGWGPKPNGLERK